MAQSTLLTFPSELIVCIYDHLDSFTDVIALARTAHIINDLWKGNTAGISYHIILPKILPCFAEAQLLFDAQHEAGVAQWHSGNDREAVIHNIKHFFANESTLSRICDLFNIDLGSQLKDHWAHHPSTLNPAERARFTRVCYLAWAYLTLAGIPDPRERLCSFLAARTMNELIHIRSVALWMHACTPESLGVPTGGATDNAEGLTAPANTWANGLETMAEHWSTRVKVKRYNYLDWDYNQRAVLVAFHLRYDLTELFAKACVRKGIKQ